MNLNQLNVSNRIATCLHVGQLITTYLPVHIVSVKCLNFLNTMFPAYPRSFDLVTFKVVSSTLNTMPPMFVPSFAAFLQFFIWDTEQFC